MWDYDDEDYRRADVSKSDRFVAAVVGLMLLVCLLLEMVRG